MKSLQKGKAVLFDFDMTLIDSSYSILACTNLLAEAKGLRSVTREEVLAGIGLPIEKFWESFWGSGVVQPDWPSFYRENYRAVEQQHYRLFSGSLSVPKELKARGYRVGVVSNRRFVGVAVEKVGLTNLMDTIIGLEDVQRPKPDPQSLLVALSRLETTPEETFYVGDTDIDMKTALAAGVRGIGVTTGYFTETPLKAAGAWRVCHRLEDIPSLLQPEK